MINAPTFLDKHEYGRLCDAIHTSQLGLFQDVLLRSLKVLNDILREIPVQGSENMTLFDLKINELCQAFKRLKNIPDLYSIEAESFRNIAVTAFVFYRTLYRDVFDAYVAHRRKTKASFTPDDPFVLFKRVPYRLYDFLGSQYWRVFEFYEVVAGDLAHLKLNQAIRGFIEKGCPVEVKIVETEVEAPVVTAMMPALPVESAPTLSLFEDHSAVGKDLIQGLITWIQEQLNQKHLRMNEGGIYSHTLKHGTDIFIEDSMLMSYSMLYQKKVEQLRQALRAEAGGKIFKINYQQKILDAYRLKGLEFISSEYEIEPPVINEEK